MTNTDLSPLWVKSTVGSTLHRLVGAMIKNGHLDTVKKIQAAWEKWDVPTLLELGAINEREAEALRAAIEQERGACGCLAGDCEALDRGTLTCEECRNPKRLK